MRTACCRGVNLSFLNFFSLWLNLRCPEDWPFAYNGGSNCCQSPFEDINDDEGINCDGSLIGLESTCCLNAEIYASAANESLRLSYDCTAGNCVNHPSSDDKMQDFNVPMTSVRSFYRFRHRSCLGDLAADCGDDSYGQILNLKILI